MFHEAGRKFSREFKVEGVRLVRERGASVAQAGRDLDVHENVLRKWTPSEPRSETHEHDWRPPSGGHFCLRLKSRLPGGTDPIASLRASPQRLAPNAAGPHANPKLAPRAGGHRRLSNMIKPAAVCRPKFLSIGNHLGAAHLRFRPKLQGRTSE